MSDVIVNAIWFTLFAITVLMCNRYKRRGDEYRKKWKASGRGKESHLFRKSIEKRRQLSTLPVGTPVLVRSNEWDQPLMPGIIVNHTDFGKDANSYFPVVRSNVGGVDKDFVCFGIVKKYDENKLKALEKLTPREQWNVLTDNTHYGERDE